MRLIDADRLCEDLLNRWSIADTKKEELIRRVMADIVTPIVASQPTVNQWIPGSERSPEEHVDVLCCFTSHGKTRIRVSHRMDYNYWNEVGRTGDMVAWMPLPEPWKGGSKNEIHN